MLFFFVCIFKDNVIALVKLKYQLFIIKSDNMIIEVSGQALEEIFPRCTTVNRFFLEIDCHHFLVVAKMIIAFHHIQYAVFFLCVNYFIVHL